MVLRYSGMERFRQYAGILSSKSCAIPAALLLATTATGCWPQGNVITRILLAPDSDRLKAAEAFNSAHPSSRVFFSQLTGNVLWIDGGQETLSLPGPTPLTPAEALAQVARFVDQNPSLFDLGEPAARALRAARDGFKGTQIRTLRFEQLYQGYPVMGRSGVAFFDSEGRLRAIQARLSPGAELKQKLSEMDQALENQTQASSTSSAESRKHLKIDPEHRRLIIEKIEKKQWIKIRTHVDRNGNILKRIEEVPSMLTEAPVDWQIRGTSVESPAPDLKGKPLQVPGTQEAGRLVFGFGVPGAFRSGEAVWISDAGQNENRLLIPREPLATNASSWVDEPEYQGDLRAATRLAINLQKTLVWMKDTQGWDSWDGKGGAVRAAIRGNRSKTGAPDVNAYGGSGYVLIGDGKTASGQTFGDALDVVAHELMHSVIDATADFTYLGESGAINESLCDFIGVSIEGFDTPLFGDGAGWPVRDVVRPSELGHPERYSEFQKHTEDDDQGGVHYNSGILNRALSAAALQHPRGRETGIAEATRLVFQSLQEVAFDPDSNLEDFAAALSAYCQLRHLGSELCQSLEKAFSETELLNFSPRTAR